MKTTTLLMLGLMAALAVAGNAAADPASTDQPDQRKACEPIYLDSDGHLQINEDCIGPPPTGLGQSP